MVTLQVSESATTTSSVASSRSRLSVAADAAVLATLGWWGTAMTWGTGAREPHLLSVGIVLLAVATLLVRPWRRLPVLVYAGLSAVGLAAYAVTLTAPTGWAGANEAASWTFAGQLAALVAAWAVTSTRQWVVLAALCGSAVSTFAKGWLAWWGGENAAAPFVGTFYWHNQEGAFLALGALLGATFVLSGRPGLRTFGWFAAPLCGAGVVFTTSRGSALALAVGLLGLLLVVLLRRQWRDALRLALLAGVGTATTFALSGPPFFPQRLNPLAGTRARAGAGETLSVNSQHRLDDWRAAGNVFRHWPLSGSGFHGFASASQRVAADHRGSLTPFAHNGYLQVLAEGGLLLALPVLGVFAALVVTVGRRLPTAVRTAQWPAVGAACGLLTLLVHSAIDFDWSYPSLLATTALTGGVAVAAVGPVQPHCTHNAHNAHNARTVVAVVALSLLALSAFAAWDGSLHLNLEVAAPS